MTANLINYWRHKEDARHNLESEKLTANANAEIARHNRVQETISHGQIQLGYAQLSETTRHNLANEGLQAKQIEVTHSHNLAMEDLQYAQLQESHRHNVSTETWNHNKLLLDEQKLAKDVEMFNVKTDIEKAKLKMTLPVEFTEGLADSFRSLASGVGSLFGFK